MMMFMSCYRLQYGARRHASVYARLRERERSRNAEMPFKIHVITMIVELRNERAPSVDADVERYCLRNGKR